MQLQKVIDMLEAMKTSLEGEHDSSDKTYKETAAQCLSTDSEQSKAISDGVSKINDESDVVDQQTAELATATKDLEEDTTQHEREKYTKAKMDKKLKKMEEEFDEQVSDLTDAETRVDSALKEVQGKENSATVIKILGDLKEKFSGTLKQIREEQEPAIAAARDEIAAKAKLIGELEKSIDTNTQKKADAEEAIAKAKKELVAQKKIVEDAQAALQANTEKCSFAKQQNDANVVAHKGEIEAIDGALAALKKDMPKDFAQISVESDEEDVSPDASSFVQTRSRVRADPLKKVKDLIHNLIVRLEREARDEAELRGSCTEQIKTAEEYKKNNQKDMMDALLNGRELIDEMQSATTDINSNTEAIKKATDNQLEEKKAFDKQDQEFADNIKEQKFMFQQVTEAIGILKDYYATQSAKGEVGNAAADAQIEHYADEKGTTVSASSNVISMLQQISADADTTAQELEASRKKAHELWVKSNRASLEAIKGFETDRANRKQDLMNFKKGYEAAKGISGDSAEALDVNLDALTKLHALCKVADAESTGEAGVKERKAAHEARVAKIKDQIKDLQNAKTALTS